MKAVATELLVISYAGRNHNILVASSTKHVHLLSKQTDFRLHGRGHFQQRTLGPRESFSQSKQLLQFKRRLFQNGASVNFSEKNGNFGRKSVNLEAKFKYILALCHLDTSGRRRSLSSGILLSVKR